MTPISFLDNQGTFTLKNPENYSYLYFPLASETGLKSAVSPTLGGDSKLDQEHFIMEPVSAENLHNNRATRNLWLVTERGIDSAFGASAAQEAVRFTKEQDESTLTAGLMWHTLERHCKKTALTVTTTAFIPWNKNVEVLMVTVRNDLDVPQKVTAYGALPIYGRSADNLRDHRNVTSMLHRIETTANSVLVTPTMSFDERGHNRNHTVYYASGFRECGCAPMGFFPTVEDFLGEGGTFTHPGAVYQGLFGAPAGVTAEGKEAMGAMVFPECTLESGQELRCILLLGTEESRSAAEETISSCDTWDKANSLLAETQSHWQNAVNVDFHTGDRRFDGFMKWVSFQPFLRRLFGCSFLPHHDYGRGGRGWRDLWQDCLSLLLMNPQDVGSMIVKNFGGVRIDGTNATIIGAGDGNFIADRNGIARVWMDHALWPQKTTKLYIDQTGDLNILLRDAVYFKDAQTRRGTALDFQWEVSQGSLQQTAEGNAYHGTILEHLLIQVLTAFYEVGDHNICRLRGADWNDALDMAAEKGESVAFTCAYAGNLRELAALLRMLGETHREVSMLAELEVLLSGDPALYEVPEEKQKRLAAYLDLCTHSVSGSTKLFSLEKIAENLEGKADWLNAFLRRQEWLDMGGGEGWFNSYYDNHGNAVEGRINGQIRMMLTGQVFALMGGTATEEQVATITRSADRFLYREAIGGYRLNTDFRELKFDMGRMFGFAYGEKENGAVFSHMAVMYASALYGRGMALEGHKALNALATTALDFGKSRIYPGIPEYFRSDGRGMYHYLTGAASWYLLTMVTQVFGVRGERGCLVFSPKLTAGQFDETGIASVHLTFAGKELTVSYHNPAHLDWGHYRISSGTLNGQIMASASELSPKVLAALPERDNHIEITLSETGDYL